MSKYPENKDVLGTDTAGSDEMTAHAELHNEANAAINAIQDFVGVTQGDGSTTIVEGINTIANQVDDLVEGLEDALGVNIDIDGNITIDPDKPSIIVPESDPTKFDRGEGELNYDNAVELGDAVDKLKQDGVGGGDDKFDRGTGDLEYPNAVAMGAAVRANEGDINTNAGNITINSENFASLLAELNLTIDGEGNISINPNPPSNPNLDISSKFDKGTGDLEYDDAVVLGEAVRANEGSITENTTNLNNLLAELNLQIDGNGEIIIIGGGEVPDLSELEQGITDNATAIDGKFNIGTGTTNLNDATAMEAEIGKNADAITKNETTIKDISSNIGGTINPDGTVDFPTDVETDLSKLATKEESEAGDTANANLIEGNTDDIKSLSNRLDALENTSLSAEWTIAYLDGNAPADGEVSLDATEWANVKTLNFSNKDKSGTEHDFTNVKEGDTIQIGVGASGRAAGSSAAYQVDSVAGGVFGVVHLASTGSPEITFTAVVAVYPAFDPSNYATKGELDAVKTEKLSKGDGLKAATARILEAAIEKNTDDISTNKTNITANKGDIDEIVEKIGGSVDVDGNITLPGGETPIDISGKFDKGAAQAEDAKVLEDAISDNEKVINNLAGSLNLEINTDGSIIINPDPDPDNPPLVDVSDKLDKGKDLVAKDAKELEEAIGENATNISTNASAILDNSKAIDANKENINNLVVNIGGSVDTETGVIELPNGGDPIDISGKFDKGAAVAADAKVLEDAIGVNSTNIDNVIQVIGGSTEGGEIVLPDPIDIDSKFDAGDVPADETRTYEDAYALEQAVLANALAIEGIDIPEGQQNVTVSEELPTADDGDNGDWWIYTPPSTFSLDGEYVARYKSRLSTSDPAQRFMHFQEGPNYLGATTILANRRAESKNGLSTTVVDLTSLKGKEISVQMKSASNDEMQAVVKFEIIDVTLVSEHFVLTANQLGKIDGQANEWGSNYSLIYSGGDSVEIDPPKEQGNTLFYKENDEWIQIGGGSGGGGYYDDSELREAINTNADAIETVGNSSVSFAVNENNADLFCNNIVTLTQAEYDALTDRDPHTLYLAVDA